MRPRDLLAALLLLAALNGATAAEWPGFRGPGSDNAYRGETPLGEVEDLGLAVTWKRRLGSGYSSVSIASGCAVTMFSDGTDDIAVALDAATGEELWRYSMGPTYRGHDGSHDGPISTPLVAGGRIFVLSPWGHLHALDLQTGEKIWSTHLADDHGSAAPLFGYGASPVFMDGVVIVEAGAGGGAGTGVTTGEGPAIVGFDPASGKALWKVGQESVNYQSPMVATVDGLRLVLATTDHHLYGLEARSGDVLWKLAHGGERYPDAGAMSMNPVDLGAGRFFITDTHDSSSVVELAPGDDGQMSLHRVWSGRSIRASYAIPVYHDGHLYAYSSRFLTCVDAATGESVWRSRQPGDGFPILVDGHLVVMTKKGGVHVAAASPEGYEEVASLEVFDEGSWTPPSFADGRIYVRSLGGVAAVELSAEAAAATAETAGPEGTRFARFLADAQAASEKDAVVDRFLSSLESFPLIEGDQVHFLYQGAAHDVALAGDMFGERTEEAMTRLAGTDLFYYSTRLLSDARVSYYFIEDFEERITDPRNPRKLPDLMGEVSWVAMPGWKEPTHLGEAPEKRRGRIESHEIETLHFDAKRRVGVYLPAGYEDRSDQRYPVAYVHGGNAALGLGGWTRTLDNVVAESVEPLVVVFLHTSNPRGEFIFRQMDAYAAMVAEEIVPAIDRKYRTLGTVESRASVGAGLAGYAALYGTFKHPGVFGRVASQSTFLITMQAGMLASAVSAAEAQPLAIFLEWGTYDLRAEQETWDIRVENRRLVELLKSRGYDVTASEVPDGHGWASWRNRNDKILEWLYPLTP